MPQADDGLHSEQVANACLIASREEQAFLIAMKDQ
jgi:hypothetical protein